jgi:16S rRNA (cytosine967-C5)-methyltransferase
VLNLLRLGVMELGTGGAPHGVVHAAVELAKSEPEAKRAAGLVNAVLRRVAERGPVLAEMPPAELPKALRKRLVAAWGKASVAAMEAVFAVAPPVDLTPRDGDAEALAAAVGGQALETGSVRLTAPGQVSALPGYGEGAFWVQDAAAAVPARILAVRPGERVLDLCAAPGGKTLQLAAAGAAVTALDLSAERLGRLHENLARCGLKADVVAADGLDWQGGPFDAVLVDAPCSASGTIRRHPDLPFLKATADNAPLLELQARLIDRAFALVKPGGRLVVCTCSLFPEEGEAQVAAALERLPGLGRDAEATHLSGLDPAWLGAAGELRIRPDHWAERGGIDGFHIAALRKLPSESQGKA